MHLFLSCESDSQILILELCSVPKYLKIHKDFKWAREKLYLKL